MTHKKNTLATLDGVFSQILRPIIAEEIEYRFEGLLKELRASATDTNDDEPLTVDEAAAFLGCKRQAIYQNAKKIPHSKRLGRLWFTRRDLKKWIAEGAK